MATSLISIVVVSTDSSGTAKTSEFPGVGSPSGDGITNLNNQLSSGYQLQQIQQLDSATPSGPVVIVFHLVKAT